MSTDVPDASPPDALPDAPLPIPFPQLDPTSITLRWQAPYSDGGAPILEYILSCEGLPTITLDTWKSEWIVRGLQQHTMYAFSIQARNEVGLSDPALFPVVQPGCTKYGFP